MCVYGHAICKISTRAIGGWWLVYGLLSWICARCGRSFSQQPCKLCPLLEDSEEDNQTLPLTEKEVAQVKGKGKGKGRKVVRHAFFQVSTCSFTKVLVQQSVAPATTVGGSPNATPSAHAPNHVATLSHTDATISSVLL